MDRVLSFLEDLEDLKQVTFEEIPQGRLQGRQEIIWGRVCPAGERASANALRKALVFYIQDPQRSQSGQEVRKRESDERWYQGRLKNEVTFPLQLRLQHIGSPSFTWCSLHFINLCPRNPVNKKGFLPYFLVLVNILVSVFQESHFGTLQSPGAM